MHMWLVLEYYAYTITRQYLPRLELASSHLFVVCLFVCLLHRSWWLHVRFHMERWGLLTMKGLPHYECLGWRKSPMAHAHYQVLRDLDEDCMIEVWGWAVLLVIRYHAKKEMSQGPPLLGVWDSVIWVKKLQLSPCNSTDMWGTRLGPFQP